LVTCFATAPPKALIGQLTLYKAMKLRWETPGWVIANSKPDAAHFLVAALPDFATLPNLNAVKFLARRDSLVINPTIGLLTRRVP